MFEKKTYIARRAALVRKMEGRGLVVLPGHVESPVNYLGNTYHFRQDSTFLYYFGLSVPGLAAVIDTDSGEATLFGDDFTVDDIIWMGPQPGITDLAASVGVSRTALFASFTAEVRAAVAKGREVHFLPPYRGETRLLLSGALPAGAAPSADLIRAVVSMRDKKSAEEIEQIEEACAIGYEMHTLAMSMCHPGVTEREIAGAIEGVSLKHGWGVSFHPIVSQHGETLHNHNHSGVLETGRLLLVDAGAEATSGYASDFTRTIPVGGTFTSRQRDIYEIVLAANNLAFDIATPSMRYVDVHLAACRMLIEGLSSLGLIRGSIDDAVATGAHSLFMPHGLGHQMGLDVHDMEDMGEQYVGYDAETPRSTHPSCSACRMGRRLEAGMVVSVEPGIYFVPALIAKWHGGGGPANAAAFIDFGRVESYLDFGGIRLEDDMLITSDGNRLLGTAPDGSPRRIPITPNEVAVAVRDMK
ncbi:MAG: aminopeptidase P family protein [Alistipes sp.]|jgi:Xaa-Pro aminopeptidase|nr:aminopeptidase P family protein [Alistipes sp.]